MVESEKNRDDRSEVDPQKMPAPGSGAETGPETERGLGLEFLLSKDQFESGEVEQTHANRDQGEVEIVEEDLDLEIKKFPLPVRILVILGSSIGLWIIILIFVFHFLKNLR